MSPARIEIGNNDSDVGNGKLKIFQRQLKEVDHLVERHIVNRKMDMRVPQHGVGVGLRTAHDRRDEFRLMLDQALHVGIRKEGRQPGGRKHAVIKVQHDTRDEREAAIALEHCVGGVEGHGGSLTQFPRRIPRIFNAEYHAFPEPWLVPGNQCG